MARARPDYQHEPLDETRSTIWASGEITPLQLLRIAAWKSAKSLASLTMNSEQTIRCTTRRALEGMQPLRSLDIENDGLIWPHFGGVATV
jgi:hypothetical protein